MKLSFACDIMRTSFWKPTPSCKRPSVENEKMKWKVSKSSKRRVISGPVTLCGTFILRTWSWTFSHTQTHTKPKQIIFFRGETLNSQLSNSQLKTRTKDEVTLWRNKMMSKYDIMPTMVVVFIAETPRIHFSQRVHSWLKSSEFCVSREDECLWLEKIQMTERSTADIMPCRQN